MSTVLSQEDLGFGALGIRPGGGGRGGGPRGGPGPRAPGPAPMRPPGPPRGPHHRHDRRVRIFQDFVYPYYPYYPVYLYQPEELGATEAEIERLRADRDRAVAEQAEALQRCIKAAEAVVTKSNGSTAVREASRKVVADCHAEYERAVAAINGRYEIALAELRKRLLYARQLPYEPYLSPLMY